MMRWGITARLGRTAFALMATLAVAACSYGLTYEKPPIIKATQIIEDAAQTLERFRKDPAFERYMPLLQASHGVVVFPYMYGWDFTSNRPRYTEYGFQDPEYWNHGAGVFVVKTEDGDWSGPAFHDLRTWEYYLGGYFHSHFIRHGQYRAAVLIVRSEAAFRTLLNPKHRLSPEWNLETAVAPGGPGLPAKPENLDNADIVVLTDTGASAFLAHHMASSALVEQRELNEGLYGQGATPPTILDTDIGEPASNQSPATTRRLYRALGG